MQLMPYRPISSLSMKCSPFFNFRITGHQITWEDVQELASSGSNEAPEDPAIHSNLPEESKESAEGVVETSRTLSFAEITALIESNETHLIPNNEEISGGVNVRMILNCMLRKSLGLTVKKESIPSEAKQRPPKKPWEIDAEKAT